MRVPAAAIFVSPLLVILAVTLYVLLTVPMVSCDSPGVEEMRASEARPNMTDPIYRIGLDTEGKSVYLKRIQVLGDGIWIRCDSSGVFLTLTSAAPTEAVRLHGAIAYISNAQRRQNVAGIYRLQCTVSVSACLGQSDTKQHRNKPKGNWSYCLAQ